MNESSPTQESKRYFALLVLGALGVVYGDIGTSPLYALRECFSESHGVQLTDANVLGVLSLVVWALILVVSIKYVLYVMSADNRGEGGELALMALANSDGADVRQGIRSKVIVTLGLFGAAFLFGDGMITPAISVLGAVEGIKIVAPVFSHAVVPITVFILIAIFSAQRQGTGRIGIIFGPIVLLWFATIAALGVHSIIQSPEILWAVSPTHAASLLITQGWSAFKVLGGVFLVVTGAEALYADMGHFGKSPIRFSWFGFVLPALLLNYLGQGALLLREPGAVRSPFYLLAPTEAQLPLLILATLTTVIASQAVITGAFSMTRQAVQLGYLPRIQVLHTSSKEIGQIYVPLVSRVLCLATLWLVVTFRTSARLTGAYGIAVACGTLIATVMMFFVTRSVWKWKLRWVLCMTIPLAIMDLFFIAANFTKIWHGGWFALAVAIGMFVVMTTWYKGRRILAARLRTGLLPVECFVRELDSEQPLRVPGCAIILSRNIDQAPPVLLHHVEHNKVLHETVILLQVCTEEVPHIDPYDRVQVEGLGRGFYRVVAHYGFMESPDVEEIFSLCQEQGFSFDRDDVTFFLGRETVFATKQPGMALWREKLFSFLSRNAQRPVEFFHIPRDRVIELGMQVEL